MRRRDLLVACGTAVAWPTVARGQPLQDRRLIGFLSPTTSALGTRIYRPLRAGLRELDYVDGRNIRLEFRYAEGVVERLPALAAELVALKPDLIIAGSTPGTLAAHHATKTIPIVMITLVDPVSLGIVKSIARPGGNVTGIWTFGGADALIGKRVGLLKEIVPSLSRIAVMIALGDPAGEITKRTLPAATRALNVTYKVFDLPPTVDFNAVFDQVAREGWEGAFVDQSPFFLTRRNEVAAAAGRVRVPAIYGYRDHAEAGGLLSYGSSLSAAYAQSVRLVDKVLKGANPAELPVEQVNIYELVVNNRTAKALGLTIPETFLLRADEVIE